MSAQLVRPILDNKQAFRALYPGAYYAGDAGDAAHQAGTGDHTPRAADVIFGKRHLPGWVYAQDFGDGAGFDLPRFARWLLDALRAGAYPEVKYVITRHKDNMGSNYYGLFDRRFGWRKQSSTGHESHIHVSYMPGVENTRSTIIADYMQEGTDMQLSDRIIGKRPDGSTYDFSFQEFTVGTNLAAFQTLEVVKALTTAVAALTDTLKVISTRLDSIEAKRA